MNNVTAEQLREIHDDYEKWVKFRPFDITFESYINEQEMKVKARLYDELSAVNSDGDAEAGDRQGQATSYRAIEYRESV